MDDEIVTDPCESGRKDRGMPVAD